VGRSCGARVADEPFPEVVTVKDHFSVLIILAALSLLPTALLAQSDLASGSTVDVTRSAFGEINPFNLIQRHWIVAGKVTTLEGDPVAGVKVSVQPSVAGGFRVLSTNFQGKFQTEYVLNVNVVKELSVVVTAEKKGFLKAHAVIDFGNADRTWVIPVTLRDRNPDPALLSQADLVSALALRLKKLGLPDGLSAKGEKDYAHGVEEFLDHQRPDRALGSFTQVIAREPSCVGCRTMLALAELESGDWDGASRNFARGVDDVRKASKTEADQRISAADVQPSVGRPEPALALGVMESWRHQVERAAGFFQEALSIAPLDPLALQEMGRMELLMHNWTVANTYLGRAIAAGASPEARLLRVEASLEAGDFDSANQEMTRYLDGRNVKTMPLVVRQTWERVVDKKKIEAAYIKVKPTDNQPIDYLHGGIPELKDMAPATDQAPLDSILLAVGKNVQAYFRNFPNTVSLEEIHQEKLSHNGKVGGALHQKFHYLCQMPKEESEPGFTEYRASLSGEVGPPRGLDDGYMLTLGFASASLIFHPLYQSESTFKYLGRQKMNDRDTFVLAFAQRPEKARVYGVFKRGENSMPTFSQGLAWVDAEKYVILRLRTDLLRPLPEVRLDKETTEIDFAENHFKSITTGFWLPREVTVSVDWNGKKLRNTHEYSDFRVFNVGTTQRMGTPKELGKTFQEETAPPAPR
jgi:tetratricopeptide (TPR) repeat protein